MATEAPSQHEIVSNIEQVIANEPEMQATFENTVVEHLDESNSLQDEIARLTKYAGQVDAAFSEVHNLLDKLNYKDSQEYKDRWQGFHNRYQELMQTSGNNVKQTLGHLKEFLDDIVPKLETTTSRKQADSYLNEFLASIGKDAPSVDFSNIGAVANTKSQDFCQLDEDIQAFVVDWKSSLGNGKIKLPSDIQAAMDKWTRLKEEHNRMVEKAAEAGRLAGVAGFGIAVGAMAVTIILGPVMWFTAAAAGVSAVTADAVLTAAESRDIETKAQAVREARAKLGELMEKKDETLGQLLMTLENQKAKIEKVSQRISGLDHIWPALLHDATDLKEYLDRLDDTSATTFRARVELCKKFYSTLGRALEDYLKYRDTCE